MRVQPALGVYNEPGLQRLDLILAQARLHNIRVIMVLSNFWYRPFVACYLCKIVILCCSIAEKV